MKDESIIGAIESLLSALENDNKNLFSEHLNNSPLLQESLQYAKQGLSEEFYFSLIYPLSNIIDGLLLKACPSSHKAQFLLKHHSFVSSHLEKIFTRIEGSPCCADKSCTVMRSLMKYWIEGRPIIFNYDGEYTYHLPKEILTTEQSILDYFDGLYSLYYGCPDKYVAQLAIILQNK